jgi:ribosomal protein S18 acetylase RimI-like enzyme
MSLEIKLAYDDTDNIKVLFSEYINLLLEVEKDFHLYLDLQNYDSEIDNLKEKYGLPDGRLYIAYIDAQAAGCIALRKMSGTECEMKRLYIKPQFRRNKIGRALVELIINDAKKIGYKYMLLDTLPSLEAAVKLYEDFGFYRIPPYNDSPIDNTIFMKLDL